jgi:hypothetical protein
MNKFVYLNQAQDDLRAEVGFDPECVELYLYKEDGAQTELQLYFANREQPFVFTGDDAKKMFEQFDRRLHPSDD